MLVGDEAQLYEAKSRSGIDLSDEALADAWLEVKRGGENDAGWMLGTYDDTHSGRSNHRIRLHSKGAGGFVEMSRRLEPDAVQFGAFCITALKGGSRVRKFVCVTWCVGIHAQKPSARARAHM